MDHVGSESEIKHETMELVVVTHVEDAITFWAQNVAEKGSEKIDAEVNVTCPAAPILLGRPDPQKVCGARRSQDRQWYRCTVQNQTEDKFCIMYIDHGHTEIVSRSDLVELPEYLQGKGLAKMYKFWNFYISEGKDSPLYSQGKTFLANMIHGKKLRIHKKSVCFDGTVLVQAFQGNFDIGEELLKFRFARVSITEENVGLMRWASKSPPRDHNLLGSPQGCMPKLRPISTNQNPQIIKDQNSNNNILQSKNVSVEPAKIETRVSRCETLEAVEVPEEIKSKSRMMKNEDDLPTAASRFSQLTDKVTLMKKLRQEKLEHCNPSCADEDQLFQSVSIVMTFRVSLPRSSERLTLAWKAYEQSLENLRSCQILEDVTPLVNGRNEARAALSAASDNFLQEVNKLPIGERLDKLEMIASTLAATFTPTVWKEQTEENALERFCEWKKQKFQKLQNIQDVTDKSVLKLSDWAARLSKFLCSKENTLGCEENLAEDVDEMLRTADNAIDEELNQYAKVENQEIVLNAFYKAMEEIQREKSLLKHITKMHELNTKFQQDALLWLDNPPDAEELFSVKKRIRYLRSQLRWKLVEVSCLEEAEDLDLPEIIRKKEEIAETRKSLFKEICLENQEYIKLCHLVKNHYPELTLMYPDADICSYMRSAGLLMKSLDREMFDAEPMRELSGKRPHLSSDFQGQKVVLKCYTVDEETEGKMLEQAAHYHTAQQQSRSSVVPLLALFFSKSDPLAFVVVPHYSNGSLRVVQKSSPLSESEICKVMMGVAQGLASLHTASVTHASLQPRNIFVINREIGIVGDYDYTKAPELRACDDGMVVDSISLVAPELKEGQPPSPASDMFAFGGIMLWLHVPDFNGNVHKEHQSLDFAQLKLEKNLQILLSKLLASSRRPLASETLKDNYFMSVYN